MCLNRASTVHSSVPCAFTVRQPCVKVPVCVNRASSVTCALTVRQPCVNRALSTSSARAFTVLQVSLVR